MPKRSSKKPRDLNKLAASIVDSIATDKPADNESPSKNAAAVALGKLGGLKGGQARAKSLSARKRKEIAKRAAEARWSRKK